MSEDAASVERFRLMERKLYFGIMTPGAALTILSGLALWLHYGISGGWLHAKLVFVGGLVAYHLWCGTLRKAFASGRAPHGHVWFRWFNEVPVLFLIAIAILVVVKPF